MKKALSNFHMQFTNSKAALLCLLACCLIFVDLLTKAWIYTSLPSWQEVSVFKDFGGIDFSLRFVKNHGAAWGLFSSYQEWLVALRLILIVSLVVFTFFLNRQRKWDLPLVLLISGAIGNVIDCYRYGFVVDFLQFTFWGYPFAVFNVADAAVTLGVAWLFFVGEEREQTA